MRFDNLTPFAAQCFAMQDARDQTYRVVAIKVAYAIEIDPGRTDARLRMLDREPVPLVLADEYYGTPSESSVRVESDLAPFKPRCDVIVLATAHAPGGVPLERWPVRLRLQSSTRGVMLDKRLSISAPRRLREGMMGWSVVGGEAVASVPIRWEHAFGGASRVRNPRYGSAPDQPEWLLNQVCFSNPVGCGWLEGRHFSVAGRAGLRPPSELPAPCVGQAGERIDRPALVTHPKGPHDAVVMARVAHQYPHQPAGFGVVGRAWAPRLAKAGSYDETWERTRWPALPEDFDFAYWNGAPEDQQIEWPPSDTAIELWHLVEPALAPEGYVRMRLPGHRAFVMAWMAGAGAAPTPVPINAVIDTLVVDAERCRLDLTWRCLIPDALPVARLEARFETDPRAPLLKRLPPQESEWPTT